MTNNNFGLNKSGEEDVPCLVRKHLNLIGIIVHVHDLSCQCFSEKQLKEDYSQREDICLHIITMR